jgi:hypothetical protein
MDGLGVRSLLAAGDVRYEWNLLGEITRASSQDFINTVMTTCPAM